MTFATEYKYILVRIKIPLRYYVAVLLHRFVLFFCTYVFLFFLHMYLLLSVT